MKIGVPKEIKDHEYRVGLTPLSVKELCRHGHSVVVEKSAGAAIGFTDDKYLAAGAKIEGSAEGVYARSDMIVKVKEPQSEERRLLTPSHVLFTYLHLAPDGDQTADLIESGACCIAYETVKDDDGRLPLLAPMSEVAGRLSIQAGARCLEMAMGGRGLLLGGVPGVEPANVTVLGAGVVGQNAIAMAVGMAAKVHVLDTNLDVLRQLDRVYGNRVITLCSTETTLESIVAQSDLLIVGVLIPGAKAPKIITRKMIQSMPKGSVIVDVAIDQGGCCETSTPTTHSDPTYDVDGVVHYCVANMPGAVSRTSTIALNNVTLPYILRIANQGVRQALEQDPHLLNGLNVCRGKITNPQVAHDRGYEYILPENALSEL